MHRLLQPELRAGGAGAVAEILGVHERRAALRHPEAVREDEQCGLLQLREAVGRPLRGGRRHHQLRHAAHADHQEERPADPGHDAAGDAALPALRDDRRREVPERDDERAGGLRHHPPEQRRRVLAQTELRPPAVARRHLHVRAVHHPVRRALRRRGQAGRRGRLLPDLHDPDQAGRRRHLRRAEEALPPRLERRRGA